MKENRYEVHLEHSGEPPIQSPEVARIAATTWIVRMVMTASVFSIWEMPEFA